MKSHHPQTASLPAQKAATLSAAYYTETPGEERPGGICGCAQPSNDRKPESCSTPIAIKTRVLIVDDDASIRSVLLSMLSRLGYEACAAEDGDLGLEALRAGDYDVALIDLQMPNMDGLTLLSEMARAEIRAVPIILSAYGGVSNVVEAMRHGALDFIEKPSSMDILHGAIERAALHRCISRQAQEMSQLVSRWETIVDASPDIILVVDLQARVLLCNQALAARMGASKQELIGKRCSDILPFDALQSNSQSDPVECQIFRSANFYHEGWDGYFDVNSALLRDQNGSPWGALHVVRDVSQVKRAAIRTAESEALFRSVIQATSDAIIIADEKGRILETNPAAEIMFGWPSGGLLGEATACLFPEDVRSFQERELHNLLRRKAGHAQHSSTYESEGLRNITERFPVEVSLSAGEANGMRFIVLTIRDITERNRSAEALREREEQYRTLVENLDIGVYRNTVGAHGRFLQANSSMVRMFGYDTLEEFMKVQVSDLYENPSMRAEFVKEIMTRGCVRNRELNLKRADGAPFVGSCTASVHYGPQGEVEYIDGVIEDVTERKAAEGERAFQTALLKAQSEATLDGILVTNSHETVIFYNKRFAEIWKLSEELLRTRDDDTLLQNVLHRLADPQAFREKVRYLNSHQSERSMDVIECTDGVVIERFTSPLNDEQGHYIGRIWYFRDITERRQTELELSRLATAIEQVTDTIVVTDVSGIIQYVNPAFEKMTGYTRDEVEGLTPRILNSGKHDPRFYSDMWETICAGEVWTGHFINRRKDGELYEEAATISPVRDAAGNIINFVSVKRDVTSMSLMEAQLRQAQKLESIGQLAAGIAHEINTPIQYVGDNARFLKDAFIDLAIILDQLTRLRKSVDSGDNIQSVMEGVEKCIAEADLEYLREEIPKAIGQSLEGIERVAKIVRAMKEFSHPGGEDKTPLDINRAIESTLTVARNEWKYVAEVTTDLAPDLPLVPVYPGDFNQVILNLVINAAHAIADAAGKDSTERGRIDVSTRLAGEWAEVRVSDTGTGIPPAIQNRIFDPFFTTKEVGKGTGQGLAISRSVIVKKHGGTITFNTEIGKGTTFIIRLPIADGADQGDCR